ncbi:5'-methylthioadenosine/S-adenosylhomocysteine nucleosidase family protein [Aspergillus lucknowensis]|uniref:Nucleoside phosphorylase domain-containing protein n=1 Tax=Aspergillus lucknowensis TaxID=176173 RepID=A0ABR4M493_9EURO
MASFLCRTKYTVGWISPLRDELVVAIEMLDEEHGMPMQTPKEDTNTYYLGKIGDHNIAMACLAGGQMGIGSAAVVGENMRRTFKNIRFALLVGIGGGVPSKEKDVRLGDVVVSYPDGPYPGIVQYDYGKLHADGEIETKGWLNAPPSKLLAAVDMLRVLHSRPKNPINNMCKIIDELGPEFAYPGDKHDSPDHLYPVEYPHITRPGSETCKSCDTTRILHRVNREHPHKPNVHYGIIASGNLVVKDGVGREKIDKRYRNLIWCCEMEAAGLVNNFPCLAIRGITDYCDSHKNDTWRKRAIAAACAYSKELLLHIERTDVEEMECAVNVMKAVQEKEMKRWNKPRSSAG